MPDFAQQPLTFTAARDFLEQKVNLPTKLGSLDLSLRVPSRVRMQAFFSARVASAHVLEQLRAEVEKIAAGESDYVSARARLKEFLAAQGYGVPDVGTKEERQLATLASTARLNLILQQNVAMAHAIGQREVSEDPAVKEIFPNYEYHAVLDENTRDEHAALDGLILPKDDPFWRTHYPPWEFNCRCIVTDTDEPANGKSAGFKAKNEEGQAGRVDFGGRILDVQPNQSGFVFESDPEQVLPTPDFSIIRDQELRRQFEAEYEAERKKYAARLQGIVG